MMTKRKGERGMYLKIDGGERKREREWENKVSRRRKKKGIQLSEWKIKYRDIVRVQRMKGRLRLDYLDRQTDKLVEREKEYSWESERLDTGTLWE